MDQSQNILFEQFSPSTFALQLLQAKKQFHPGDLILGGLVEGDLQYWAGDTINLAPPGVYQQGHGLYFTQASFDVMGNVTPWSAVFLSVADSHVGRPGASGNNIYLPHAFIALGKLDAFPLYATLGINTIPFGIFIGTGSVDTPLTAAYFNPIQAPQFSLAYYKNGWNLSAAAYSDEVTHHNNVAYSVYYSKVSNTVSYSAGAGYLTDLNTAAAGNPTVVAVQKTLVTTARGKNYS